MRTLEKFNFLVQLQWTYHSVNVRWRFCVDILCKAESNKRTISQEALSGRMTGLRGRMTGLRGRMAGLRGRMAGLSGRMTGLRGRMTVNSMLSIRQLYHGATTRRIWIHVLKYILYQHNTHVNLKQNFVLRPLGETIQTTTVKQELGKYCVEMNQGVQFSANISVTFELYPGTLNVIS